MDKLKSLHQFLASKNQFDENQLDSWAEKATLIPSGRRVTVGLDDMQGVEIGHVEYTGVFVIENYAGPAFSIFAQVFSWQIENDDNRERFSLGEAEFDVDPLDNGRVDIEIRMPFVEPLCLVPDDDGAVQLDGRQWRVESPVIYEAESAEVLPAPGSGGAA